MYLLFALPKCPQCEASKKILQDNNIEYKEILVSESIENAQLAIKYNVKMGGTVIDDETGEKIDLDKFVQERTD